MIRGGCSHPAQLVLRTRVGFVRAAQSPEKPANLPDQPSANRKRRRGCSWWTSHAGLLRVSSAVARVGPHQLPYPPGNCEHVSTNAVSQTTAVSLLRRRTCQGGFPLSSSKQACEAERGRRQPPGLLLSSITRYAIRGRLAERAPGLVTGSSRPTRPPSGHPSRGGDPRGGLFRRRPFRGLGLRLARGCGRQDGRGAAARHRGAVHHDGPVSPADRTNRFDGRARPERPRHTCRPPARRRVTHLAGVSSPPPRPALALWAERSFRRAPRQGRPVPGRTVLPGGSRSPASPAGTAAPRWPAPP